MVCLNSLFHFNLVWLDSSKVLKLKEGRKHLSTQLTCFILICWLTPIGHLCGTVQELALSKDLCMSSLEDPGRGGLHTYRPSLT